MENAVNQRPQLSPHFESRKPSVIRLSQILFNQRADRDTVRCINLAIGNVSLPMHPALQQRMRSLGEGKSPFAGGVVMSSATAGLPETRRAMLHVIGSSGLSTAGLEPLITDGGSSSMEIMALGVAGPKSERPLVLVNPIYTNYADMCRRGAIPFVAVPRELRADGYFTRPDLGALESTLPEGEGVRAGGLSVRQPDRTVPQPRGHGRNRPTVRTPQHVAGQRRGLSPAPLHG